MTMNIVTLPKVFIGSSKESLEIARVVKRNLQKDADVSVWYDDGLFDIGKWPLESLENYISKFDFAIFILSADDQIEVRKEKKACPRDNVIFELGLFMGHLGRERTYILQERGVSRVPSDFDKITVKRYDETDFQKAKPLKGKPLKDKPLITQCRSFIKLINELSFRDKRAVPIYSRRLDFMQGDFIRFIRDSKKSVKILNIAFTVLNDLRVKEAIKEGILKGVSFEVLLVMRKRPDRAKLCGDPGRASILKLRMKDECNFGLIPETNRALFELFIFLLEELWPLRRDSGERLFDQFQVKEYSFIPVVCMYIFDDIDLIFGPYISLKCDHIPLIHLKNLMHGDISSAAFNEMVHHYHTLSIPTRGDKTYISEFSYFDGDTDISIHQLIEDKNEELLEYLTVKKRHEYINYLINEGSTDFDDDVLNSLGDFKSEGKFDAVMRNIMNNISKEVHP
jgi:hypothetical protein